MSASSPQGSRSRTELDQLNRTTKLIDPLGGITRFGYDPNGNLLSFKDAKNNETIYTYDNMDRVKTRKDPLLKQDVYEYELGGALKKATDRRGLVNVFEYDILGRSVFTGFDQNGEDYESTITWGYDQVDRLTSAVDSLSGTITLEYDPLDRLKSETTPKGSVAYTYDAVGNRKTMTVGGQPQVAYGYDNAHRLTSITQGSQAVGFGYDNADRQTSQTMPGGITSTYAYDAASQLSSITHKAGAATLGDLVYGYDLGGRRSSVKGTLARTELPAALPAASYDANNRLNTWGSTSLSYDNGGNLTADGTNNYTWNARGQLASISGGATASFGYDAFGRRSSATVAGVATGFHYHGSEVVQELNGTIPKSNLLTGGTDQRFTRTDSAGTKTYLTDALGSTVALADQSGALQTQYSYTPFGKTTSSGPASTNTFQFTGRENDGTGLQYNRARYYHPTFGRFISEDPLGFAAGDPNLYGYVGNSPFNLTDPSGMIVPWAGACLGGAAFGAAVHVIDMNLSGRKATVGSVLTAGGIGCGESVIGLGLGRVLGKVATHADEAISSSRWSRTAFKGSRVYQRNDLINPGVIDKFGRTNLQRMHNGLAPIGPDGNPINLHHMLQTANGPIAEVTQTFHQAYSRILHINPNTIASGINRSAFDSWRQSYWMWRAGGF